MDSRFICTDLHIESDEDLTSLAAELNGLGVYAGANYYEHWTLTAGPSTGRDAASSTLCQIRALESLSPEGRALVDRAKVRSLHLGFISGTRPFALHQVLPSPVLKRAWKLSFSIQITLYRSEQGWTPFCFYEWTSMLELEDDGYKAFCGAWRNYHVNASLSSAQDRVATLRRRLRRPGLRLLHLGAGDGETVLAEQEAGFQVTAIEQSSVRAEVAVARLRDANLPADIRVGTVDSIDVGGEYDAVTVWAGFGAGSDASQRRLLRRISSEWLKDSRSRAFVNVFDPPPSARCEDPYPVGWHFGRAVRHYNVSNSRLCETAKLDHKSEVEWKRSLRCYSIIDFELLLDGTGLRLHAIEPGEDSFTFVAVLAKDS